MPKLNDLLSKATFKTAPRSAFPQPNEVKYSSKIGYRYPVQRWMLNPGDTIDVNLQQLTRFAPLAAPIMHHFITEFIALEIPDRLSMPLNPSAAGFMDGGQEQFHNLYPSSGGDSIQKQLLPQTTMKEYVEWLGTHGINPIGTLLDFLGYPCFKDLFRLMMTKADAFLFSETINFTGVGSDVYVLNQSIDLLSQGFIYQGVSIEDIDNTWPVYSYITWLADNVGLRSVELSQLIKDSGIDINSYKIPSSDDDPDEYQISDSIFLDYLLKLNGMTAAGASKAYYDYVFSELLSAWIHYADAGEALVNTQPLSLDPLYKYWVGVYDWFINTNIEKSVSKAEWLVAKGLVLVPNPTSWLPSTTSYAKSIVTPQIALWNDDYFTSSFDTPAAGGSVSIAGLSTIQQFREASAVDRLRILLQYAGRRTKDQVLGLFGVKSSDARFDRCRVLGVARFSQQIEDVTQTSASDVNGVLGDFAGKSISVGQQKGFIHFTAEEHCSVMVFAVVKPIAVYDQVMPADILKISAYDYLIPYLDKVGEQIVRKVEIYPNVTVAVDAGFGYQRRYAEYMWTPSRVMGEFGTSLDFWHDAREFDSQPALNRQFISVDVDQDNLDRIFAVRGDGDQLRNFVYFDTVISRPLPKYVQYGF